MIRQLLAVMQQSCIATRIDYIALRKFAAKQ